MINDSGERREFNSGAVRDIQEGKGRMDLLPLDVISGLLPTDYVLKKVCEFLTTKDISLIDIVILRFLNEQTTWNSVDHAILDVSIHYEEGAKKYGERNWEKGIPTHCYLDSALRHYFKWKIGMDDERHDRAFVWNLIGLKWTIMHRPSLDDIYYESYRGEADDRYVR